MNCLNFLIMCVVSDKDVFYHLDTLRGVISKRLGRMVQWYVPVE